jgi:hypothetical protein
VILQMEHNKAPGPDGFPAEFYQACWDIIESDLMVCIVSTLILVYYSQNVEKRHISNSIEPYVC